MGNVSQAIEAVKNLQSNLIRLVGESMLEHKEEITGLLVHQQQEENVDSEGQPLREYSFAYKTFKRSIGQSDNTTLHLTGRFQSTIDLSVDAENDTYTFDSPAMTDKGERKSTWLNNWNKARGGADVMKLTNSKKPEVLKIIMPTLVEKSKQVLSID